MSDIKKRFSRRDFLRMAGGTAATLPVLAACSTATEEATEAPDVAGPSSDVASGQRGGLWFPPEPPELKEVVTAVNTPSWFTNLAWRTMLDRGFVERKVSTRSS
jgi:hypothetical protein